MRPQRPNWAAFARATAASVPEEWSGGPNLGLAGPGWGGPGGGAPAHVQAAARLPYFRRPGILEFAFLGLGQSASRGAGLDPRRNQGWRPYLTYNGPIGRVYVPYPRAVQQITFRPFNGIIETIEQRRGG